MSGRRSTTTSDPTTPDAVEMLDAVLRRNPTCNARALSVNELHEFRSTILAERARHAEEVARLRDVHLDETRALDDLRLKEIASLRDQLHQAKELVSVLEERLDAFEDTEPDARACAEWVIDITQYGDTRQAARRYLSGVANRTATRLHRDVETLRSLLRKVEGERDALAVRMDLPASQLLMVGSELCGDGKIDPNDHRDPR